jgi:calcineurin-like phosphoesterase family protein
MSKQIWFTSDHHFDHQKIISFAKRPYKDVEEMNEALIANYNEDVNEQDDVYILGDFSFHRNSDKGLVEMLVHRLKGHKHFLVGNHDEKRHAPKANGWAWVGHYKRIKVDGQRIVLMHYPILSWHGMHDGAWMLHGHSHGNLPKDMRSKRLDVGVDCWNYRPVNYDTVAEEMKKHEFSPIDHHGRKGGPLWQE